MKTLKAYTDLEQSKKLADILPFDSADMSWVSNGLGKPFARTIPIKGDPEELCACWSLAALLDILPKDESIDCAITFGYYNGKCEYIEKWLCAFEKEAETTGDFIIETIDGSNPIDACVDMIMKLHELKML
jgi:hypothetical protein